MKPQERPTRSTLAPASAAERALADPAAEKG